jgi:hypothetical protein
MNSKINIQELLIENKILADTVSTRELRIAELECKVTKLLSIVMEQQETLGLVSGSLGQYLEDRPERAKGGEKAVLLKDRNRDTSPSKFSEFLSRKQYQNQAGTEVDLGDEAYPTFYDTSFTHQKLTRDLDVQIRHFESMFT